MATLKTKTIQPSTGTNVNLGNAGTAILVNSDSIQTNVYKDSGGNTIVQSDGAGTLSNVNTALTGAGPKLISTSTVSSAVATIEFTSGIDSTYDEYVWYFINIQPATNATQWLFQCNADGQTGYNENMTSVAMYIQHYQNNSGTSGPGLTSSGTRQGNGTSFQCIAEDIGNGADESLVGEFHLLSPSNTTYVKEFWWKIEDYDSADKAQTRWGAGYFLGAAAIDEIQFKFNSGNINAGKVKMYGIS